MRKPLVLAFCLLLSGCGQPAAPVPPPGPVPSPAPVPAPVTSSGQPAVLDYKQMSEADSMCNMGVMYQHGQLVAADPKASFDWYLKAAQAGHPQAPKFVGLMYKLGRGTEKNHAQALVWLKKSYEFGNAKAATSIGEIYRTGSAGEVDHAQAHDWYLKAAETGDQIAAAHLVLIYQDGLGVPKDLEKSRKWMNSLAGTELSRGIAEEVLRTWSPAIQYDFGLFLERQGQTEQARGIMERAAEGGEARAKAWLKSH